ncbi:LysR family transcriptional regulator [Neisseriaceae bacterium JH1-16]|nr:LysR family transcriptional regulator [Neisseriaceae bacterium JH1-16]
MQNSTDASAATRPDDIAWDDVRYFLALARLGSLSAAARALAVEHSTVSRRVGALETRIGLRLFDRLPRSWQLTDEGRALLEPAQRIEAEALAFSRAALGMTALQGTVRLSAPPVLASQFLMPLLAAQRQRWPGIVLDLVGEVRAANLHRRDADLAIRLSRPDEPGLVARRLGSMGYGLYGSRRWLETPRADWALLGYGEALQGGPHQAWLADYAGTTPCVLVANDFATLHQACRAGLGVTVLPHFIARGDPELVVLDEGAAPMQRDIWLAVHPDVRRSPRVQRIAELIVAIIEEQAERLA